MHLLRDNSGMSFSGTCFLLRASCMVFADRTWDPKKSLFYTFQPKCLANDINHNVSILMNLKRVTSISINPCASKLTFV